MQVKTLVSAFALSAAMFAAPAFAQTTTTTETTTSTGTTMGTMTISEEDLPAVQQRCEELTNTSTGESLLEDDLDTDESATGNSDAGSEDATLENAPQPNEALNATSDIDLDTITLEMCEEAGINSDGAM